MSCGSETDLIYQTRPPAVTGGFAKKPRQGTQLECNEFALADVLIVMDRFVLTGDMLTNIKDIDEQHRVLFKLANQIVEPSTIERGPTFFREVVATLREYVHYHFAAEELTMQRAQYPRAELHRHWHDTFRTEVATIDDEAKAGGISKALKLRVSFAIENWLLEHIRISDRELAEFLVRKSGLHMIRLPDASALKAAGMIPDNFDERAANH
jgi:hemerythrin-like metal-binding protein